MMYEYLFFQRHSKSREIKSRADVSASTNVVGKRGNNSAAKRWWTKIEFYLANGTSGTRNSLEASTLLRKFNNFRHSSDDANSHREICCDKHFFCAALCGLQKVCTTAINLDSRCALISTNTFCCSRYEQVCRRLVSRIYWWLKFGGVWDGNLCFNLNNFASFRFTAGASWFDRNFRLTWHFLCCLKQRFHFQDLYR